jgi:O-antigen/teichoic acid export membrane protein
MGSNSNRGFNWDIRSIGMLSAGSILSQSIIFITTLCIAKLYKPEEFGSYAIIISIANLISPFLTLSKEIFIVPIESDQKAFNLLREIYRTFCINTSIIIVITCVFLSQKNRFEIFQNVTNLEVIFSIVLAILFALHLIFQQILLRSKDFKVIAMRGPIQSFGVGIFQVILGSYRVFSNGLVVGEVTGRLTSIGINLRYVKRIILNWKNEVHTVSKERETKKNHYFANFISILFDLLCISLALISASLFYGEYYSGQISMSLRIAALPTILIGAAFSQYILANGSSRHRELGRMTSATYKSILLKLIPISLIFSLFLFIAGEWFITPLLGESWELSGDILKMLAPLFFVGFVWAPVSSLFYVNHMWVLFLKVTTLRLVLMLSSVLVSQLMGFSFEGMIFLVYFSSAIVQVIGMNKLRHTFA